MGKKDKQLEEALHVELLWPLVPTGDADGSFDWFTGVVSLNVSSDTWKNVVNPKTDEEYEALRTYAHELFHFYQFTTLGFLYKWAGEMMNIIRPVVKRVREETDVNDLDFAGTKRLINEGSALLLPHERKSIEDHMMKIDKPGISGLTTRAIFESHAYFAERKLHYKIDDVSQWLPHINSAPDNIYRVAFDFLAYTAGFGVAYEWLPLVASMSLCSDDPVETFERVALALRPGPEDGLDAKRGMHPEEMVELLMDKLPDFAWLIPTGYEERSHMIFGPATRKLHEAEKNKLFNRINLYVNPASEIANMIGSVQIQIPLVLRAEKSTKIPIEMPAYLEQHSLLALLCLAAVGKQLTRDAEKKSYYTGNDSIEQLAWLVNEHIPINFELATEDILLCDPARMAKILKPKTKDDRNITRLWGRCFFVVPADIEPDQSKAIEETPKAISLLKAVQQDMPLLPVYFGRPFGQNWLAIISPDEAIFEGQFNILEPQLRKMLTDSYKELQHCGKLLNLNTWLAEQCLFDDILPFIQ